MEETFQENGQMHYNNCRFCAEPLSGQKNFQCLRCGRAFDKRSKHACNGKFLSSDKWKSFKSEFCCAEHERVYNRIREDIDNEYFLDQENKREFTESELKSFQKIQEILKGNR